MHLDRPFTAFSINNQPIEPSDDTIKSNLKYLKIRPKDVDGIVKDSQNAYKMVFEQVFLLMRCIRYLITDERNTLAMKGRMRFLQTVFDSQENADHEALDVIQNNILQKLENNVGSNDMIAYLQTLESDESASILRRMQENGVAFAPIAYIHGQHLLRPYPYYDMYMCLQHPLDIFTRLLKQKIYEPADIERVIYDRIKYHADCINPKGGNSEAMMTYKDMAKEQQQRIFELGKEDKFAQILREYTSSNKEHILQEVSHKLAIELGNWASDIFAKISNPSYSKLLKARPLRKQVTFNDSFKISNDLDRTIISIQSGLVGNLYKLNQLDDLFDSLKLALKAKLDSHKAPGRPHEKEDALNNEDALTDISAWYDRYSTGMFRKIDQIPKAIVSIIYFDLDNDVSRLKDVLPNAEILRAAYDSLTEDSATKKSSPVKERNLLLTCINSLNLYLNGDKSQDNLYDLINRIKYQNTQNIDTLIRLNNPIMSLWTVFEENKDSSLDASFGEKEQDKMMYRFKTVPVFFKRSAAIELRELVQNISNQAGTVDPVPFPYNSAFPWPLWIRTNHVQESNVIIKLSELAWTISNQPIIETLQPLPYISKLPWHS